MRRSLWFGKIALVLAAFGLTSGRAAAGDDCLGEGLKQLRSAAPDGYAIYEQVRDPEFFGGWVRCDDAQFDLSTAVHESTHVVTSATDAFPLIGGGTIRLPHEVSRFYAPRRIAGRFHQDEFTTIYLRLGKASSSTDFLFLLDELNAYSHDLNAAVDLKALVSPDQAVDHRDGLAALMAFVAVYAETAKASEPDTWRGLRDPRTAEVIATLWTQAERVMASSCGIPNFGTADKAYIRRYCAASAASALTPILGRPPICPDACLQPDAEAADVASDDTFVSKLSHRSAAGPSWIAKIIRSRPAVQEPATELR